MNALACGGQMVGSIKLPLCCCAGGGCCKFSGMSSWWPSTWIPRWQCLAILFVCCTTGWDVSLVISCTHKVVNPCNLMEFKVGIFVATLYQNILMGGVSTWTFIITMWRTWLMLLMLVILVDTCKLWHFPGAWWSNNFVPFWICSLVSKNVTLAEPITPMPTWWIVLMIVRFLWCWFVFCTGYTYFSSRKLESFLTNQSFLWFSLPLGYIPHILTQPEDACGTIDHDLHCINLTSRYHFYMELKSEKFKYNIYSLITN